MRSSFLPSSLVVAFAAVVSLHGCSHLSGSTRLPEALPGDLVVEIRSGGGMLPDSSSTTIAASGCAYQAHHGSSAIEAHFTVTGAQLAALYHALRDNSFDRIQVHKTEVTDRGGTTVSVSYGDQHVEISDAGMSFVDDDWRGRWDAVVHAIDDLTARGLESHRVTLTFTFDPSLAGATAEVTLAGLPPVKLPLSSADLSLSVRALPGSYPVQVGAGSGRTYHGTIQVAAGAAFRVTSSKDGLALERAAAPAPAR